MKRSHCLAGLVGLLLASPLQGAPKMEFGDPECFVFFAVLEGLYEEGVGDEALKLIVPNPESMLDEEDPTTMNFVYACPVCRPSFDAFRLYLTRPDFYGLKVKANTFGEGLSPEVMEQLQGEPADRREQIRQLIDTWVKRKLDRTALTDEERHQLEEKLSEMRTEGERRLKAFQAGEHGESLEAVYQGWTGCPFCEGAAPDGGHARE